MHGTNCVYFEVVTHVPGGKGLARKVGDPIKELVVTIHDEAFLLAVGSMDDIKCRTTSISMFRQIKGLIPYRRNRESLHYCTPNFVPFTVYGRTDSHTLVRVIHTIRRVSSVDVEDWSSPSAVSTFSECHRRISSLHYTINRE